MNTEFKLQDFAEIAKKLQEPVQAMVELNVKTVQGLSYLKPEELAHIKKPEELVEKQFQLAIENGRKGLDYLQKSFQIMEKTWLGMSKEFASNIEKKH